VVSAPARLVLLRHAATDAGPICVGARLDPGLSEAGREQARDAAQRLDVTPDLVVASPLRRAEETAAAFGPGIVVEPRLAERDFGAWEGRPWAEIWDEVDPAALTDPVAYAALTPPDGETAEAVAARVADAVDDLTSAPGRTVLAVTHAGPLRLAVAHALRLDVAQTFALAADHARAAVLARFGDAWVLERLGA
jgi:broad specificity phosphatase PhoE